MQWSTVLPLATQIWAEGDESSRARNTYDTHRCQRSGMLTLQPGDGSVPGRYHLPSTPETVSWGYLPNAAADPVLTVTEGETVTVDTLSHEGVLEDQGRDPLSWFGAHGVKPADVLDDAVLLAGSGLDHDFDLDGPHVVTGPIAVAGARTGDVLKVDVLELTLRTPYGVISNRHGLGALAGEFPEGTARQPGASAEQPERYGSVMVFSPVEIRRGRFVGVLRFGVDRQVAFPLAPFMGIMGVAPATETRVHSVPPGPHGGNIDVNLLQAGASLYLPVLVDGALFHVGDPHYAQGDGEVALTAMEASLRGTFRLSLLRGSDAARVVGALDHPLVETDDAWVPIGLDEDLDEAMRKATRRAIAFLEQTQGMPRHLALAYLSAAADFEVSQVVDAIKGVHCVIRKRDFAP
jgi:acetamidase/formamidase